MAREVQAELEATKEKLEATQKVADEAKAAEAGTKHLKFLLEIGDWAEIMLKEVKNKEGDARKDEIEVLKQMYQDEGSSEEQAKKKAKPKASWNLINKRRTTDMLISITEQQEIMHKWSADGKSAH